MDQQETSSQVKLLTVDNNPSKLIVNFSIPLVLKNTEMPLPGAPPKLTPIIAPTTAALQQQSSAADKAAYN